MKSIWRSDILRTKNPLRFFFFASRPHWRAAFAAIFFVIIAAVLQSLIPYVYKMVTDGVVALQKGNATPVYWSIAAYVAIALGGHIVWRLSGFTGMLWASGVRATGRDALYAYLSRHSYQYFSDRFAGGLLSKIKQAADGVRDLVTSFLWDVLSFTVTLVTSFIIIYVTNPLASLVLILMLAVVLPFNYFLAKKRVPISAAAQGAETMLNGATVDSLTNIASVHEFAKREYEIERLRDLIQKRRLLGLRNWRFGEWMLTWNGVLVHLFMAGLMFGSVYLVLQGMIAPGDIVLFLATTWLLEGYFVHLSQQFDRLSENWGQITESLDDILAPHEVLDTSHALPLTEEGDTIVFDDVSFRYGGGLIFDHLTFSVPDGERVGIVGRSGAGKSTLMKVLLRHYDLESGHISVGGRDIALVTKESLRNRIAVVPQEPGLFHRTIHENIAYARPEATREEVIRAASLAQAHEFIIELPGGYDSLVGERGIKLSGGQRQRIAIARALLKNTPILLLDEATSALDSESEVLVQKALLTLMEGRTVIAIAHRLSTLRAMDRVIVFDNGKILEDGTHEDLLARNGVYADLWNHQAGGFIEDDDVPAVKQED